MLHPVFAQAAAAAPAAPGGSPYGMLITMVLIFGIFYFMMIRPQQRKEKERKKAIETLHAGQRVLFAGGLIGTICESRQYTFVIELASGAKVEVARGAVTRELKDDEAPAEPNA